MEALPWLVNYEYRQLMGDFWEIFDLFGSMHVPTMGKAMVPTTVTVVGTWFYATAICSNNFFIFVIKGRNFEE